MDIEIDNPTLEFLEIEASALSASVPIKVIRSAREKMLLIKAVPLPQYLTQWRSLGYRAEVDYCEGGCSVSLHGGWRMGMVHAKRDNREVILVDRIWKPTDEC